MKQFKGINILAPNLFPEQTFDETKILGLITWLWYQDKFRRENPTKDMMHISLPAIKSHQFVLFSTNEVIGYCTYAYFSAEAESLYCQGKLDFLSDFRQWLSGERLWIINWFAPSGHHRQISKIMKHSLFPDAIARSLIATATPNQLKAQHPLLPINQILQSKEIPTRSQS